MESYVPPKEDKKWDGQPKTEGEDEELDSYEDGVRNVNTLSNIIILFNAHQHCIFNSKPLRQNDSDDEKEKKMPAKRRARKEEGGEPPVKKAKVSQSIYY